MGLSRDMSDRPSRRTLALACFRFRTASTVRVMLTVAAAADRIGVGLTWGWVADDTLGVRATFVARASCYPASRYMGLMRWISGTAGGLPTRYGSPQFRGTGSRRRRATVHRVVARFVDLAFGMQRQPR